MPSLMKDPQWVGAIATLGAVLVALFKDSFKEWFNKPVVKLVLSNDEPYVLIDYSTYQIVKLFRFKVVNKGRTPIRNCRVKLVSVINKEKYIEPDVFKWSSSPRDMRYRIDVPNIHNVLDVNKLTPIYREAKDVSPGDGEFCDIFRTDGYEINFICSGKRDFQIIDKKEYEVNIEVIGDNISPKKARFLISNLPDPHKTKVNWLKNSINQILNILN